MRQRSSDSQPTYAGSARGAVWSGFSIGVKTIAAGLSLIVLLGSGYAWASYNSFQANKTTVDITAAGSTTDKSRTPDADGSDQNILLVGNDDRTGATPDELAALSTTTDGGGVNTDTMMVLHVPADGSKATGISIPRDSWVAIPGFGMGKLNSAYNDGTENGGGASGGAQLLIKTISNLTGLSIDHYVAVSMLGFYRIAKVLGPINVCLNEAAVDSYSGTDLPKGVSSLNASQALSFVRQRHNLLRGDLDREVRQQYFLSTEFRKITKAGTLLNPLKLNKLLKAVSSSLTTDKPLDIAKFAEQVQSLSAGDVSFATIPITGTPDIYPNGVKTSIVAIDRAAIPGFIAKVIGPPTAYIKAKAAAAGSTTVQVVNAAGVANLGSQTAASLVTLGFKSAGLPTSAADATTLTTISYPAGLESQAKALAAKLPGAAVAVSKTVKVVTLTMGSDKVRVKTMATAASPKPSASASSTTATSETTTYSASSCIN